MAQFKKSFPNQYAPMKGGNPYAKLVPQNQPKPKAHIANRLADALASILASQKGGCRVFTSVPAEAVGTPLALFDPQDCAQRSGHVFDLMVCKSGPSPMLDIICTVQLDEDGDTSVFPHASFPNLQQTCIRDPDLASDPAAITTLSKEIASQVLQGAPSQPYALVPLNISQFLQTSHDAALGRLRAAGLCALNKAGTLVVTKRGTSTGLVAEHTPGGTVVYLCETFEGAFMKAMGFTKG